MISLKLPPIKIKALYFSPLLLSTIFFIIGLWVVTRHAMWGDEIQAWLIARDSHSFYELIQNSRYEGHPILWFVLLMGVKEISGSLFAMQFLHVLIATGAVYLFLKYSPFTRIQKILFILGYYPFYEYLIISRNYGIGVLLIFAYCTLLKGVKRNQLLIGAVLFLLAQTNIFGLIISIAAIIYWLIDQVQNGVKSINLCQSRKFYIALCLAGVGVVASILEMAPPADTGFSPNWLTHFDRGRLEGALAAFSNAFFPLPSLQLHFWNTPSWNITFSAYLFAPLAISICFLPLIMIWRNLPLVGYIVISVVGIEAFLYMKYPGYWRHHGYLFIIFISAIWLEKDLNPFGDERRFKGFQAKFFNRLLNIVLLVHFLGAVIAHTYEARYPFSSAKLAGQYLSKNDLDNLTIVAHPSTISLLGYLNKTTLFYPNINAYGSFIKWNTANEKSLSLVSAIQVAKNLSAHLHENVVFLTTKPLSPELLEGGQLNLLARFDNSIFENENFYVYLVRYQQSKN